MRPSPRCHAAASRGIGLVLDVTHQLFEEILEQPDKAIDAYRAAKLPFPEGTIIARIAWRYVPSEENNKIFGREQSFVPGEQPSWYLQFMVKDSTKYASTGGWGYAQFDKDGKPGPESDMKKCFPCHQAIKERDFVFTRYAP